MIIYDPGNREEQMGSVLELLEGHDVLIAGKNDASKTMKELLSQAAASDSKADKAENLRKKIKETKGFKEKEESGQNGPFFYFYNEEPDFIYRLQDLMKEAGLAFTAMAMHTPNNENWTLGDLYLETEREARWFEKREELIGLIQQADPSKIAKDPLCTKTLMACAEILKQEEPALSKLDQACLLMKKVLEKADRL